MKSIESVDFATLSVAIQAVRRLRDPEARGAARSV